MALLNDSVVLITGGAGGIGAAAVRRFAARGNQVVIADLDRDRGEALAAETGAYFVRTDVRDLAENEAAVAAAVERFGRLDVVHLNAGTIASTSIGESFAPDRYRHLMGVNLDSVVYGVQAAHGPLKAAGGGRIVVTASATGMRPSYEVFYAASKHAVVGLVRSLGPLLEAEGIRINALCPGLVDTPLIADRMAELNRAGMAVSDPESVVDALETVLADPRTGLAWLVMADRPLAPFEFADLPVAREKNLLFENGGVRAVQIPEGNQP
ncbi:NAD(P)-dependent dehydrogenase (short-subunit alcohol dehydrogenase family) [Kitasatospora sp. MAA4]|uniref:SDR family NAD(P)-dependent oxidoreductase n=1 Tax=Kitasatospora sp. MAA4 TaxID=3035093 RepID=UPI0024756095|nr:SDR family NAD(P)-dependent oxidoreductase [Kitasatospora sp. MAA4]MDH6131103.1 NAD(P)-dependent dehydrogenase (short-subunit alcohol dehydrogenase family) [Kitasatospora sp. MAA4]